MRIGCLFLALIVILSFSIFYYQDDLAFGTQCAGRSIQGNFDLVETAFLGNVTSIQYVPFSDVAKITFDVQHVFKGDTGKKITIHYDLKQTFSERITFANSARFIVLPEEKNSQSHVSFCTPVYHAVPTIVNGFYELEKNHDTEFGNLVPWTLSEELLPEEIKKIEGTQKMAFAILGQNIDETKQLEKNLMFVVGILMISAIIAGIIAVVVFLWKKRR